MFIIDFSSFHNGLKHFCSLKLVSILRATLWKVVMKCKLFFECNHFLNVVLLFGLFFPKCSFFEVRKFYLTKYQISNQLNFFSGSLDHSMSNYTKFLDPVTRISWIVLKFSPFLRIIEI